MVGTKDVFRSFHWTEFCHSWSASKECKITILSRLNAPETLVFPWNLAQKYLSCLSVTLMND